MSFEQKLAELPPKVRWFVMTDWNCCPTEKYDEFVSKGTFSYFAWGEEICPDTGRPHHQCFMRFKNPRKHDKRACCKIADWWGDKHNYVAPMVMGYNCNEKYCKKEGKFHEIGNKPSQGERTDLTELKDQMMDGLTVDEIVLDNPILFHQYGRTLERIEAIRMRSVYRNFMTEGIWITGKAGYGKDFQWRKNYSPETHYVKNKRLKWWDGYKQQEICVFSEFRAKHLPWDMLLDLIDEGPFPCEWRNKECVPFMSKKVIITSVLDPVECYWGRQDNEEWNQFFRRFKVYKILEKHGEPVLMDNSVLEQKCSEGNIRTSEPKYNSPIWEF